MEPQTGLILAENSPYPVIRRDDGVKLLKGSLIDGGVGMFTLTQLRVPAGGGVAWTVDTLEGPTAIPGKDMNVIVGGMRAGLKKWWIAEFGDGESGPPDCISFDGMTGNGVNSLEPGAEPGAHDCASCPWNRFKSARNGGAGKDCSDYMIAMVFREGSSLPDVLNIPAGSLKAWQSYSVKLANAGKSIWHVVTRLALEPQKGGAVNWSKISPSFVRDLSPEEIERFDASREVLSHYLDSNLARL